MGTPADFRSDTAVTRLASELEPKGEGALFSSDVPAHWNYWYPSGGVVMATALRAVLHELSPGYALLSAHAIFCAPVPVGVVRVRVKPLRRGRLAQQWRAELFVPSGEVGAGWTLALEVVATAGVAHEGPDASAASLPADVLSFEDATPLFDGRDGPAPFFHNFEGRLALGPPYWRPYAPSEARVARWHRYLVPPMVEARLDPLAILPVADTMPQALFNHLGSEGRRFHAPSLDLTVHFLRETSSACLLTHCHARSAVSGFATADVEVWDDRGQLVAFGTQMMILRPRKPQG